MIFHFTIMKWTLLSLRHASQLNAFDEIVIIKYSMNDKKIKIPVIATWFKNIELPNHTEWVG